MARQLSTPQGGFMDRASQMMGMSSQSYSMQQKKTPGAPGKTIGGGLMSGMGGAAAGGMIGSAIAGGAAGSVAPGYGTAIGAMAGLAAYFLG